MAAGRLSNDKRGVSLLLDRVTERPPAGRRLAARVGDELARFLLFALAPDQRGRSRRGRRGSSSP
jgi:hypothetical protein